MDQAIFARGNPFELAHGGVGLTIEGTPAIPSFNLDDTRDSKCFIFMEHLTTLVRGFRAATGITIVGEDLRLQSPGWRLREAQRAFVPVFVFAPDSTASCC